MKKELFCKLLVLTSIVFFCGSASADIMAYWDFGDNAPSYSESASITGAGVNPTILIEGGHKDIDGKNGIDGQAAAWDDVSISGPDAQFTITIDATDWKDMSISWYYKSENDVDAAAGIDDRGPGSMDFSYYLLGMDDWVKFTGNEPLTRDGLWYQYALDISTMDIFEGRSSVQFKVDDLTNDETGGKFWVDNIEITGTPVPEPATMLLMGVGGVLLRRSKR